MVKSKKINRSPVFQEKKEDKSPYTPLTKETAPTKWGTVNCPSNKLNDKCIKNIKYNLPKDSNDKIEGCYSNPFDAKDTKESCWRQQDSYSRVLRIAETPLSRLYFAPQNVDYHRKLVQKRIYEKYGMDIGVQPFRPTEFFMLKVFGDVNCDMCQDSNLEKGLKFLNKYTADGLLERVGRNLGQHIGYLKFMDEASWSVKIDNPKYTRATYKNALPLSGYYNGCPNQI